MIAEKTTVQTTSFKYCDFIAIKANWRDILRNDNFYLLICDQIGAGDEALFFCDSSKWHEVRCGSFLIFITFILS